MKLSVKSLLPAFALAGMTLGDSFPFERIDKNDSPNNSMVVEDAGSPLERMPQKHSRTAPDPAQRLIQRQLLLILDLQEGLYSIARDFDATLYRDSMMAHAAIGQVFDIPVVMTTSAQQGPNGPLPQEILDMYPDAPLIQRQGEVNAWDNAEFRDAIRATNKSQVIMAGIVTDVCTTFLALSLRDEGYSVWANVEASGTTTPLIRDVSNDRMARAGVQIVSLFSIVCDLMRDWRTTPGAAELFPWLDRYYPAYGMVARAHRAAIENGTVIPGEASLPN